MKSCDAYCSTTLTDQPVILGVSTNLQTSVLHQYVGACACHNEAVGTIGRHIGLEFLSDMF